MPNSSAATVQIQDATVRDSFAVTRVLTEACVETSFGRGLGADPSVRREHVQVFVGGLVADTIAEGIVRVAVAGGEVIGAALWSMDHGTGRRPGRPDTASGHETDAPSTPQLQRQLLQELADDRSPPMVAHHRLLYIGVHPDHRGRGIADDLLVNHHALLHLMHIPALVITDGRCEALFARHRYNRTGQRGLLLGGVPVSVMWRRPDPADPV